jgi:predicted NBD/HSP70 family sugar kinase
MGILGIDIGGTNIRVGLVEGERVCKIETSLINKNHNKDEIIEDVISL